jgi:hypothetical protein
MATRALILLASVAIGLAVMWISPVNGHNWYDPECCSDRDCFPVPGKQLADGRYLFLVLDIEYIKTEAEIRPSRDENFHACQPAHKKEPVCFYAPRAGS